MVSSIEDLSVEGKRVFVRVDLNAPLKNRKVADDSRLQAVLPTVQYLIDHGARTILASHLGRPKGKVNPELSMEPVAAHLAGLLDTDILLTDEPVGDGARKVVADVRDGQVALLENLRFNPGETKTRTTSLVPWHPTPTSTSMMHSVPPTALTPRRWAWSNSSASVAPAT
jgi:phosphoglycerate kinase